MNMPKGFYFTLAKRTLLRLVAWAIVPFALIKVKPIIGAKVPYDIGAEIPRYKLPDWAAFLEMPDDYNFPAYEPTMMKIYNRFGWRVATWVNLSFRNVGLGLIWEYGVPVSGYDYQITQEERAITGTFRQVTKCGFIKIIKGYSSFKNWKPEQFSSEFVAVPTISIRLASQDGKQ